MTLLFWFLHLRFYITIKISQPVTPIRSSTRKMPLTLRLSALSLTSPPPIPNSFPNHNVIDLVRNHIADSLAALSSADPLLIFLALDTPNVLSKGDLLVPVPRLRLKGISPKDAAHDWADKFPLGTLLSKVKAEGPFLQFFIHPHALAQLTIPDILSRKASYGYLPMKEGKTAIVEFSSPNIAKPFHAGHLRLTIIGGFLANLYEKVGWKVIRMNYLGDWGKQFGILAVGFTRFGNEQALLDDPINHLFEVYVKINQIIKEEGEDSATDKEARRYFMEMESGDEKALALWRRFRDLSIKKYRDTYARLNIQYDVYSGESQVSMERMQHAISTFELKLLVHVDRGAKLIDLTRFNKKLGKCLVQKSDGTSLYLTRDVGEAARRYDEYKFDKMIYVVACQQDLHMAQFFELLKQMDYPWAKTIEHINYGMVEGMSTRKGTVVFLDDILKETRDKMHEVMQGNEAKYAQIEDPLRVADLVGISAVMIQDMQLKRINNYEFKWERMLSFEGDTGPYLQYAHSRLSSVQRKANIPQEQLLDADYLLLTEECATSLLRTIAQYPDVVRRSYGNSEPLTIVTYLFNLTHLVSLCYDVLWVAGQEPLLAASRLALYAAARQVLHNGMTLLGLTPVDRM